MRQIKKIIELVLFSAIVLGLLVSGFTIYQRDYAVSWTAKIIPGQTKGTEWMKDIDPSQIKIAMISFQKTSGQAPQLATEDKKTIEKMCKALLDSTQLDHLYSSTLTGNLQFMLKNKTECLYCACCVDYNRRIVYGRGWQSKTLFKIVRDLEDTSNEFIRQHKK